MLAAIDGAKTRINFETYVFNDGEIGDRFVDALARAAQRGVIVRIVLDPIGSSLESKSTRSTESSRREAGLVQPDSASSPSKSRTIGPIARRSSSTATSRSPAAWASPTTGSATRRTRNTGATRISGSPVPPSARSKASFYENWIESGGLLGAGARSGDAAAARPAPVQSWCGAIRCPARATSSCMYLLAIGAAQKDDRHPVAVHHARPDHAVEPRPGARARRQDSHAGRGRHHRRHAGQARQPLRLSAVCSIIGFEVFEYQPTMMHTKAMIVDGDLQHHRFGQLRQSFVRAERRARHRRLRRGAGGTADRGTSRTTSSRRSASRRTTWPKQRSFDGKTQRVVLELLRGDVLRTGFLCLLCLLGLDLILHERRERLDRLVRQAASFPGLLRHAFRQRDVALEGFSQLARDAFVSAPIRCSPRCARTIDCRSSPCRPSTTARRSS